MDNNHPTRGQIERTLSQRILAFYRQQLGHQPSKVTCLFFENKLAIIIEDSITTAEKVLAGEGQQELARKVRSELEQATKPQLRELIKEIVDVEVIDLLSDATLETGRTGMLAVLATPPKVRNPESIPKTRARKLNSSDPSGSE